MKRSEKKLPSLSPPPKTNSVCGADSESSSCSSMDPFKAKTVVKVNSYNNEPRINGVHNVILFYFIFYLSACGGHGNDGVSSSGNRIELG